MIFHVLNRGNARDQIFNDDADDAAFEFLAGDRRYAHSIKVRIDFLSSGHYPTAMKATITSKGQITIPVAIREKLGLKPGDQIDFDENSTILMGRRVVNPAEWNEALEAWRSESQSVLQGHPWDRVSSSDLIDELRGGPVESDESNSGSKP